MTFKAHSLFSSLAPASVIAMAVALGGCDITLSAEGLSDKSAEGDRPEEGRPDEDRPGEDRPDEDRPDEDRPDEETCEEAFEALESCFEECGGKPHSEEECDEEEE